MGNLFERPPKDPAILQYSILLDATPSSSSLVAEAQTTIANLNDILNQIEVYKPCMEPIRKALSSPKDMDLQQVAFSALLPNVKIIENFYNVAAKVAAYLPKIASELSTPDKFAEDPALANLLLQLLIKIYTVDQKKMMCPGLQNDFSFYRRSVGKFTSQAPVSETVAGQISMWIADAAPLISVVSNSLKTASKKDMNVILSFSKMANMTAWIIVKDNELETAQVEQLLLALTSAIILFDRASRAGAFEKNSPVMMRKCLNVMCSESGPASLCSMETVEQCKNGIRHCTQHYRDGNTPAFVEDILE